MYLRRKLMKVVNVNTATRASKLRTFPSFSPDPFRGSSDDPRIDKRRTSFQQKTMGNNILGSRIAIRKQMCIERIQSRIDLINHRLPFCLGLLGLGSLVRLELLREILMLEVGNLFPRVLPEMTHSSYLHPLAQLHQR